ncbi:MAG: tryptophan synthase subunit alpha, partial [Actinomycetia bacterium]|nr:tryptophan synthase subunit alpha [Actinomycetes bacterium]
VTGARTKLPEYLTEFVKNIKSKTDVPVAVGFGISQPAQAGEVANYADGVIVGSAIIDIIENSKPEEAMEKVRDFGEQLVSAVNNK